MKKLLYSLSAAALICLIFVSCQGGDDDGRDIPRDETLLYGKWLMTHENGIKSNYERDYWRYNSDRTGSVWVEDPSQDVGEDEAQHFTWELNLSELRIYHGTEMAPKPTRAVIPKVYVILELTETTLRYKDDYDSYTFRKQ